MEEDQLARTRAFIDFAGLTSCDACGGGCCDPECWNCHSNMGPENLRMLAENLATAAMLCRAHYNAQNVAGWAPGCNLHARIVRIKHRDGSDCTCDPRCTCHPPERRDEPLKEIYDRGSFHLRTCPAYGAGGKVP